jgi:uncharacterized membrane protein
MKKIHILLILGITSMFLTYCSASKRAARKVPKATYTTDVTAVINATCSPCHIPAKGGNKKPYDNYANVVKDIDEIIRRIELNPTDRGFMPFKKTVKLNDSTINVFKKWKADGMIEK